MSTLVFIFLELDVLYITVQNEFQWIGGDKNEMSAVHLDIMTVTVSSLCQHFLSF
jgi:vacuolar protein sorting-associated protein 13A/C